MGKKKIEVSKKTYTFIETKYNDGTSELTRINDGFVILELLGICNFVSHELTQMAAGLLDQHKMIRQVIVKEKIKKPVCRVVSKETEKID